ncbi:MAG: 3-dehydroquinate synthase, partial [Bacteroidia bacterium]|nr:3-dehydroquinate synthase [Bacteroidia bacterium]
LLQIDLPHFIVPYGEGYKNLNSCEYIWKRLAEHNAHRNTIILCLGGGIICDMGAFAGSCFQRGMRVILCPTSLLAMVDASIGGKNGVNFLGFKNYIGGFNKPENIFICHEFLATLPSEEIVNGYVEMLKHGLIADKAHYDKVKVYFFNPNNRVNQELIADSIAIKQNHVEQDFKDKGVRKRLNFGHTIGHAIESWSLSTSQENSELSHGVAVALGIIVESYISAKVLQMPKEQVDEITTVLQSVLKGIKKDLPDYQNLEPYLKKDKKNIGEEINFSLLESIGNCIENQFVSENIISEAIEYLHSVK